MKTFTKTIESSRLEIMYDNYASSPRSYDNLGYFITVQRNKVCPDGGNVPEIEQIVKDTADMVQNTEEHMNEIIMRIKGDIGEEVLAIYPVYCYEHGNVSYKRGTAHGFDFSNCGYYIITHKTQDKLGTNAQDFERIVDAELEEYTAWANGEVYAYNLYDEQGEEIEQKGGFYGLEDIRAELPEEWSKENLSDYLK